MFDKVIVGMNFGKYTLNKKASQYSGRLFIKLNQQLIMKTFFMIRNGLLPFRDRISSGASGLKLTQSNSQTLGTRINYFTAISLD